MMMEPFDAYKKYLALKHHFTSDSYDYFKYNGKVNVKSTSFDVRKDKYMFYKLSKKKDVEGYLIANMLNDGKTWIGDLLSSESEEIYINWLKRQESLSYVFQNDISKLDDDMNMNFKSNNGEYPLALLLLLRKEICLETLIIIDNIISIFNHWNKSIQDTVVWPDIYRKCLKYKSFLKFDKKTYVNLLKSRFTM
jgi:hypothetical protein